MNYLTVFNVFRQLEQSSTRHISPVGSEDPRLPETENDRHFR